MDHTGTDEQKILPKIDILISQPKCMFWLHGGKFFMIFVVSCLFGAVVFCFVFENQLLKENLKRILSENKTDWIQIRPNILPGLDLICVQIVCRGYQQTTIAGKELKAQSNVRADPDFCCLLITFEISLDPDRSGPPNYDPNCLTL